MWRWKPRRALLKFRVNNYGGFQSMGRAYPAHIPRIAPSYLAQIPRISRPYLLGWAMREMGYGHYIFVSPAGERYTSQRVRPYWLSAIYTALQSRFAVTGSSCGRPCGCLQAVYLRNECVLRCHVSLISRSYVAHMSLM